MSPLTERDISDPLTAVTRQERKWLLITNLILAAIVFGLTPAKISFFGIEIPKENSKAFVLILECVAVYFVVGFILYAQADLRAWKTSRAQLIAEQTDAEELQKTTMTIDDARRPTWHRSGPGASTAADLRVYDYRSWFELWLPVVVGIVNPLICAGYVLLRH